MDDFFIFFMSSQLYRLGDKTWWIAQWLELETERSRVQIPVGSAGEFSSPGSTFCADSNFGIRSTPVLPQ